MFRFLFSSKILPKKPIRLSKRSLFTKAPKSNKRTTHHIKKTKPKTKPKTKHQHKQFFKPSSFNLNVLKLARISTCGVAIGSGVLGLSYFDPQDRTEKDQCRDDIEGCLTIKHLLEDELFYGLQVRAL